VEGLFLGGGSVFLDLVLPFTTSHLALVSWVPYVTIFKQQQFVSNPMTGDNQSCVGFLGKYFRELDNNLLNGSDSIPLNWVRVLHFC